MILRHLPRRPPPLPHRSYAKRPRPPPKQAAGTYYETRRRIGWWRRQDFDDKMTYVVTVLAIISTYAAYATAEVHRGPAPDPYGEELLRIEREARLQEEKEMEEYRKRQEKQEGKDKNL